MEIIDNREDNVPTILLEEMQVEDVGVIREVESENFEHLLGHVVLRIGSGVVSLTDPNTVWEDLPEHSVELVDSVLTIETIPEE